MSETKMKKPIDATTDEVAAMKRDGDETENFWWSVDGKKLAIYEQRLGEKCANEITMPIEDARKMIEWLTTPQKAATVSTARAGGKRT